MLCFIGIKICLSFKHLPDVNGEEIYQRFINFIYIMQIMYDIFVITKQILKNLLPFLISQVYYSRQEQKTARVLISLEI